MGDDELRVLVQIHLGWVTYEGELPPASLCGVRMIEQLVAKELLEWGHVVWASKRIAKLTPAGLAAIESGRHSA